MLFAGQRHTGHIGAGFLRQIEAHTTPARADIENLHPGFAQQQLGRDVPLLVVLGAFEIVVGAVEIRTGILPVAVQEEIVEIVGEIVVMGDVLLRLADRIVLLEAPEHPAYARAKIRQPVVLERLDVATDQVDQIEQRPFFDCQGPVHIGFADGKPGVQQQPPLRCAGMKPNGNFRRGSIAEFV